jgi:hypothetical protein
MQIVLDENLPLPLKQAFGPADTITTVQELGWAGITVSCQSPARHIA